MPQWDPAQYRVFERERSQPARDLCARARFGAAPARVVDLGCGPGNSTALLVEAFDGAEVRGIDSSAAMIRDARARLPGVSFEVGDAGAFARDPANQDRWDVVFSNAALHWLDDHAGLFPALLRCVREGGRLAVQMPRNFLEPTHACARALALEGRWAGRLRGVAERIPVHEPAFYYDLLAPHAREVQVWETAYQHVFEDAEAVVQWTLGSALRPYLERLEDEEQAAFLQGYREAIARAYPPRPSGAVLMMFRRLFFVATH